MEILVLIKLTPVEKFHTQLALYYVQTIFKLCPRATDIKQVNFGDLKLAKYLSKLKHLLELPDARYDPRALLEQVRDSFLMKEEIFLYGKTKQHDQVLKKLLMSREFKWAEKYCAESQDSLLTKLFKHYVDIHAQLVSKAKENAVKYQKEVQDFKKLIGAFLKKYVNHA